MTGRAALLVALTLAACGEQVDPLAGLDEPERSIAEYEAMLDADPCVVRRRFRGSEITLILRPKHCLEFEPEVVMRGVWFHGYEESGFIPNVQSVSLRRQISPDTVSPEFNVMLDIDEEEALRRMGESRCTLQTCAFAITFVGRRSMPYRYANDHPGEPVVAVNALLSGRLLGPVRTTVCLPRRECFEM